LPPIVSNRYLAPLNRVHVIPSTLLVGEALFVIPGVELIPDLVGVRDLRSCDLQRNRGLRHHAVSIHATRLDMTSRYRPATREQVSSARIERNDSNNSAPESQASKLVPDHHGRYFPANSFFTVSLTSLPSTRAPANFAMVAFITLPMSFMVGDPISAMVSLTLAITSASLTNLGM
jgi:hypothetical protein